MWSMVYGCGAEALSYLPGCPAQTNTSSIYYSRPLTSPPRPSRIVSSSVLGTHSRLELLQHPLKNIFKSSLTISASRQRISVQYVCQLVLFVPFHMNQRFNREGKRTIRNPLGFCLSFVVVFSARPQFVGVCSLLLLLLCLIFLILLDLRPIPLFGEPC